MESFKSILKKVKIYLTDAYYLVFRYPSETELRLQKFEGKGNEVENTRLDQHYHSYTALKRRHRKIKMFFISLIPISIIVVSVVFFLITSILSVLLSTLGFKNNPFKFEIMMAPVVDYFKNFLNFF
ncbi:MAG TPA: hypothetical protein DIT25_02710 [Candidatus Moranbacteria bacterium]|nr:hypothetical protein [Candidatus Moranbacteria bacterium]